MIKEIRIKNYKSIVDLTLELGKTNVFIGENGCGKTNILEAVAMLSGIKNDRLTPQDLSNIGVRVAKPSLTKSSFLGNEENANSEIEFEVDGNIEEFKLDNYKVSIGYEKDDIMSSNWKETNRSKGELDWEKFLEKKLEDKLKGGPLGKQIDELFDDKSLLDVNNHLKLKNYLERYIIYDLNTPTLRGQNPQNFSFPLGVNGEHLDSTLASFGEKEMSQILKYKKLISWLDEIILDENDKLKFNNLRLKGNSQLYFSDRFMKKNSLFNSENANEGVLYLLFYLTLFIHKDVPKIFAIDNIETALNPHLCRKLMKTITELNKDKQVLITTHNPAILDGLNLMDDDIRLFAVRRNETKGDTKVRRIQFKKGTEKKHKLSEMWMRGTLGAISTNY